VLAVLLNIVLTFPVLYLIKIVNSVYVKSESLVRIYYITYLITEGTMFTQT